jgi:hypothetical protein
MRAHTHTHTHTHTNAKKNEILDIVQHIPSVWSAEEMSNFEVRSFTSLGMKAILTFEWKFFRALKVPASFRT